MAYIGIGWIEMSITNLFIFEITAVVLKKQFQQESFHYRKILKFLNKNMRYQYPILNLILSRCYKYTPFQIFRTLNFMWHCRHFQKHENTCTSTYKYHIFEMCIIVKTLINQNLNNTVIQNKTMLLKLGFTLPKII